MVKSLLEEKHPLYKLHGRRLGSFNLSLTLGTKNPFGARYFYLHASDSRGKISRQPIIIGLFNSGAETAYNWIEVVISSQFISFEIGELPENQVLITRALYRRILRLLSSLLPTGSHFMVEYDSPQWLTTRQALAIRVPPIATPLGSLLFDAGCGVRVKDWYLAEGGKEGWRKFWGYKALNESHAEVRAMENARELLDYLLKQTHPDYTAVEKEARLQARRILKKLPLSNSELREEINQVLSKKKGVEDYG